MEENNITLRSIRTDRTVLYQLTWQRTDRVRRVVNCLAEPSAIVERDSRRRARSFGPMPQSWFITLRGLLHNVYNGIWADRNHERYKRAL